MGLWYRFCYKVHPPGSRDRAHLHIRHGLPGLPKRRDLSYVQHTGVSKLILFWWILFRDRESLMIIRNWYILTEFKSVVSNEMKRVKKWESLFLWLETFEILLILSKRWLLLIFIGLSRKSLWILEIKIFYILIFYEIMFLRKKKKKRKK